MGTCPPPHFPSSQGLYYFFDEATPNVPAWPRTNKAFFDVATAGPYKFTTLPLWYNTTAPRFAKSSAILDLKVTMYDGFGQTVQAWPQLQVNAAVYPWYDPPVPPVTTLSGATANYTYAGGATQFSLMRLSSYTGSQIPIYATVKSTYLPDLTAASAEGPSITVVTIANCSSLEVFDNSSTVLKCVCQAGAVFVPANPRTKIGRLLLKRDVAAGQCQYCPNVRPFPLVSSLEPLSACAIKNLQPSGSAPVA